MGPGGLMGGLMLVGALGAGGGGLATISARSLTTGSRTNVQHNLVLLEALARAKHALSPYQKAVVEGAALANMEASLREELALHQKWSDKRARISVELRGKLKDVRSTRKRLAKDGIIAELDDPDHDGTGSP